jgi:hypothetical protein
LSRKEAGPHRLLYEIVGSGSEQPDKIIFSRGGPDRYYQDPWIAGAGAAYYGLEFLSRVNVEHQNMSLLLDVVAPDVAFEAKQAQFPTQLHNQRFV